MPKSRTRTVPVRKSGKRKVYDPNKPIEPVFIDASAVPVLDDIHIFSIFTDPEVEGDDKVETRYYMPGFISPSLSLRVLEVIELRGYESGVSFALHEVLGEEAHEALKNCDALKGSHLDAIMEIVMSRVMAALDAENTGN